MVYAQADRKPNSQCACIKQCFDVSYLQYLKLPHLGQRAFNATEGIALAVTEAIEGKLDISFNLVCSFLPNVYHAYSVDTFAQQGSSRSQKKTVIKTPIASPRQQSTQDILFHLPQMAGELGLPETTRHNIRQTSSESYELHNISKVWTPSKENT